MKEFARFIADANYLRSQPGDVTFKEYANVTLEAFGQSDESIPVIICARNEEADLPATLAGLARSYREVLPIVVDNGSTDETASIAKQMGAIVIPHETKGKMGAFQAGLDFIRQEIAATGQVLSTDADSIVNPWWSSAMSEQLTKRKGAGILFGPALVLHGESLPTDILRTVALNGVQLLNKLNGKPVGARGFNTGVSYDNAVAEAIQSSPGDIFPGADVLLRDAVQSAGGFAAFNREIKGTVITRGDRYESVGDYVLMIMGKKHRHAFYQATEIAKANPNSR